MSGEQAHRALLRAGVPNAKIEVPAVGYAEFAEALPLSLAVLMLHGEWGEDGGVQGILERRNIPFTGSGARASGLAMDKNGCKKIFAEEGIPTPRWCVAGTVAEAGRAVRRSELRFPLFVKPNYRGSSVGAGRVDGFDGLDAAVRKALSEDSLAIIEEMVVGRELTIGWLDGGSLPIVEMCASGAFYDYDAKYLSNETRYSCPAELEAGMARRIGELAEKVALCIGVRDVARVDVLLGGDGPMVLEVNTLPGYTTHSLLPMAAACAGMSIEALTMKLAGMAAARAGISLR
jgi:D-alanine-D-alanine ligase and related ATP-grasp enzymes